MSAYHYLFRFADLKGASIFGANNECMSYPERATIFLIICITLLMLSALPVESAERKERAVIARLTESQWLNGYYLYSWSPQCRRAAFAIETVGNTDIWSCDREGRDLQRLTSDPGQDILPSWSPDGGRIAFISNRGETWNLWVMNDDGKEQKKLFSVEKLTPIVTEPVWSPDSSSLITISFKSGFWDLWRVDSDNRNAVQLTHDDRKELAFSWIENGEKILFASTDEGRSHICVMNSDGTEMKRLTPDEGVHLLPCASSDGTLIAYVHGEAMESSIASMDLNGGEIRSLTDSCGINTLPRWDPDSGKICFISNRSGSMDVWTMGRSGDLPCQLTVKCGSPFGLRWAAKDLISFMTYGDSLFFLKTINPLTSHSYSLIPSHRALDRPCWLPDGTGIIASYFNGSISQIISLEREKGTLTPLFPELGLSQRFPAVNRKNGEIAFSLISERDSHIACTSMKGGEIRQITSGHGRHILPSWSGDGSSLAFYSNEGDVWELSIQKKFEDRARKICRIGQISDDCCPPVWTDKGLSLITVVRKGSSSLLAEISAENASVSTLDRSDEGIESPCLSPDSRYVYYFRRTDGREELWRADRLKKMRVRMANTRGGERKPCVDVSGDNVVFTRNGELWRASLDGKGKEHLFTLEGEETMPIISSDGRKIAFISIRGNNRDICVFSFTSKSAVSSDRDH